MEGESNFKKLLRENFEAETNFPEEQLQEEEVKDEEKVEEETAEDTKEEKVEEEHNPYDPTNPGPREVENEEEPDSIEAMKVKVLDFIEMADDEVIEEIYKMHVKGDIGEEDYEECMTRESEEPEVEESKKEEEKEPEKE